MTALIGVGCSSGFTLQPTVREYKYPIPEHWKSCDRMGVCQQIIFWDFKPSKINPDNIIFPPEK